MQNFKFHVHFYMLHMKIFTTILKMVATIFISAIGWHTVKNYVLLHVIRGILLNTVYYCMPAIKYWCIPVVRYSQIVIAFHAILSLLSLVSPTVFKSTEEILLR